MVSLYDSYITQVGNRVRDLTETLRCDKIIFGNGTLTSANKRSHRRDLRSLTNDLKCQLLPRLQGINVLPLHLARQLNDGDFHSRTEWLLCGSGNHTQHRTKRLCRFTREHFPTVFLGRIVAPWYSFGPGATREFHCTAFVRTLTLN
jgi:hypothetical protein